jgi:TonB-dependent SusC/RagA subfamily outer membrane receptor
VGEALQGRAAGVVAVRSGQPGTAPQIRIRGAASGSGEPLYVLDGMVVDAETVNSVPPSSLDRIEVLKDAAAGAIWGSRAVNGVIVLTSRRGSDRSGPTAIPKYHELEDVDYIEALQETPLSEKYGVYLSLRDTMEEEPSFYFDVAEHFYKSGMKEEGLRVLSGLADLDPENHQLLRAIGYMLESWGLFSEAVPVYRKVLEVKEEEPQSYRDLALALYGAGAYGESLDLLYRCLSKDWGLYEARYAGLRPVPL